MRRSGKRLAVAAVYLGTFMATLAISIVTVALPAIQVSLKTDLSGLQWVVGAYALSLSAFMLSAGPLGDRFGRKRAWLGGVALFMAGSTICAFAPSLPVLIVGCSIQGVAGALVIPGALSILTQTFPDPRERAHIIGGWSSFSAVSLILGPMLGGILVDNVGWPSIFLINLPVGAAGLLLGARGIVESADPGHAALDPLGQVLSVVFLGSLTYGLIGAGSAGWGAASTLMALGLAAMTLVFFIALEMRMARPVLPVDLFRDGLFASVNFASFVLGFAGYSSLFFFSLFLQQAQGWSATQTGWRMAPVFAAMAITSFLFGRLAARQGMRRLMILGYLMVGCSMLAMASFGPSTPYVMIAPLFALLGIGMGLAVPSTGAMAMEAAPRERSGTASATMNALRQGGMTIGIALLGTILSAKAIRSMADRLSEANVGGAAQLAREAVTRQGMSTGSELPQAVFEAALARAFADGFSAAMALAGFLGLVAALVLGIAMRRAASALSRQHT